MRESRARNMKSHAGFAQVVYCCRSLSRSSGFRGPFGHAWGATKSSIPIDNTTSDSSRSESAEFLTRLSHALAGRIFGGHSRYSRFSDCTMPTSHVDTGTRMDDCILLAFLYSFSKPESRTCSLSILTIGVASRNLRPACQGMGYYSCFTLL